MGENLLKLTHPVRRGAARADGAEAVVHGAQGGRGETRDGVDTTDGEHLD